MDTRYPDAFRDTDELERVKKELARSNEVLARFTSLVSQDLEAPLRRLVSSVEMMADEHRDGLSERGLKLQEKILNYATRMQAVVSDINDYAAYSTSRGTASRIDPKETMAAVLSDLDQQIEEAGASVEVLEMAEVHANPEALGRVLRNLVQNGIKYRSDSPPLVTVSSEDDGETIRITVEDNGVGFGPMEAKRLFELGFKGHAGLRKPGSGIGLALVKLLVEDWGGRVWAESEISSGARFHFTVPRAE
jgi:light-regulated signal transduction histidine kinase (bacteriophytochrome)